MLFTSYTFWGFVAILFLGYYLVPKKLQWTLLLLFSYLFYFIANAGCLIYILVTTVTIYLAAVQIGRNIDKQSEYLTIHKAELSREEKKNYRAGQKRIRRKMLIICLLFNLGILALLKYGNFFLSNVNGVLNALGQSRQISFMTLALPLGISFYSLQALGYLIDVYNGIVPAEKNPFKLALFVSFFPQLVQGPISRFGDLSGTLFGGHTFEAGTVCRGLQRVLWGYFKKLVIADRILAAVSTITSNTRMYRGTYIFVGMLFYTVELYADFSGGIDITIGIAQALGITVCENFNRPYFSKSLKEYWRRWHISMCTWFRTYVFYPVSTSKAMQKLSGFGRRWFGEKVGRRLPIYIASFVVWFATGIWHGASWNFVFWGLANWVVLMISEELEPCYAAFHNRFPGIGRRKGYKLFQTGRTFLLVCCLNLFDCYVSLQDTCRMVFSMFVEHNWNILWDGSLLKLGLSVLDYGILIVGAFLVTVVSLIQRSGSVREKIAAKPHPIRFVIWFGLFLIVILMGTYGIGYDSSQFIYNRF